MSTPSDIIASQTKNCSFNLLSIEKFLALMATQQAAYSDISYKANGTFALVLRAKKNGIEEVALKVLECTEHTDKKIQAMEKEYAICKQLPSSDYFMAVQSQFYLTELNESDEQSQSENLNTARKVYFVQQMEMCQESLYDNIQHYQEKNKDLPSETFKELLAIQMLDAVNLIHQKHLAHGNIATQNFQVSPSQDYPVILKLCNFKFISSVNTKNPTNQAPESQPLDSMHPVVEIQNDNLEQDLVSLGKVFLQLDNYSTNNEFLTKSNSEFGQTEQANIYEANQINQNTFLSKIACSLLRNSRENSSSARSMLLLLLQKHTGPLKIPLFSVVLKNHLDSLRLPICSKRIRLDQLTQKISRQHRLNNFASWFNSKGQRKTQLTLDLIKSALNIMFEWKEFGEQYDVLGVGVDGVVFGVENLQEKRKCALKLSLCTNKAEKIREIGIRRICQAPYIVNFYGQKFFQDANGNEFVALELERCKYSLIHHLELQRIYGEYSDEQKNLLTTQILDSVGFLHENRILLRNIKIDSFLITENGSEQAVVKLANFSHAIQFQDNFEVKPTFYNKYFLWEYSSNVNCIFQRHNRESPLYFAPEKWENPDLSTCLTDSFSVGICIFLIARQIVCSEEQIAEKLLSFPLGSFKFSLDMNSQINTKAYFKRIAEHLLMQQPEYRSSLLDLTEKFVPSWQEIKTISKNLDKNNFQQQIVLTLEDRKAIDDFKQAPMVFFNVQSVSLNKNKLWIPDIEAKLLINLISNLHNLLRISLKLTGCSNLFFEGQSPLSPLSRQVNLAKIILELDGSSIGNQGAKFLSPLAKLSNLSNLTLNLKRNRIGYLEQLFLLSPLTNLLNLSILTLNFDNNDIGLFGEDISLLSPLKNLIYLSSLTLKFDSNYIRQQAASLLSPLANLLNLSNLTLNLDHNEIVNSGSQSFLSPLVNLLNLSNLTLDLNHNLIRDKGEQSPLSPLENFLNLSSLTLNLENNYLINQGGQFLLSPLSNLLNLSNLTINLNNNPIYDFGAQSLLFPLANLLNLSILTLKIRRNVIGSKDVKSLVFPLSNLLNLSTLSLDLNNNQIQEIGAYSLIYPLSNLINLSRLSLSLQYNSVTKLIMHQFECSFKKLKYFQLDL